MKAWNITLVTIHILTRNEKLEFVNIVLIIANVAQMPLSFPKEKEKTEISKKFAIDNSKIKENAI